MGGPAGIQIEADDVTVEDVVVDDCYIGVAVIGVRRTRLVEVTIRGRAGPGPAGGEGHILGEHDEEEAAGGRGDGVSPWNAESVLVRHATISGVRDGVYLSYGSQALLDGNRLRSPRRPTAPAHEPR